MLASGHMIKIIAIILALLAAAPLGQAATTEERCCSAIYSAVVGKLDGMRALAESWELIIGPNAILSLEHRFLRIASKISHKCTVKSDKTVEEIAETLVRQLGKLEGEIRELRPFNMPSPNMWRSFQEALLQTAGRMLKGFNEAVKDSGLAIRINVRTREIELNKHKGQHVKAIWRAASARKRELLDRCKVAYHEKIKHPVQERISRYLGK